MIAVDTPFLVPEFLSYLAERAMASGAVVTTPEIDDYTQPLCTVYSLDFLPIAEQALQAGQLQDCSALSQRPDAGDQRNGAAPVCLRRGYV